MLSIAFEVVDLSNINGWKDRMPLSEVESCKENRVSNLEMKRHIYMCL